MKIISKSELHSKARHYLPIDKHLQAIYFSHFYMQDTPSVSNIHPKKKYITFDYRDPEHIKYLFKNNGKITISIKNVCNTNNKIIPEFRKVVPAYVPERYL